MRPNLYDYLKILALLAMIIDHIGFFLYPDLEVLRVIGRIAFPLFLFLVGWNHSFRFRPSLWCRGILLQALMRGAVWFGVREVWSPLNILLAIWWTRVLLWWLHTQESPVLEWLVMFIALLFASQTQGVIDYGTLCIVFGLIGYLVRTWWWTMRSTLIIILWVLFQIVFMNEYRWFWNQWLGLLIWIWVLLSGSMIRMSYRNSTLLTHTPLDSWILRMSKHALELYVLQGIMLALLGTVI